MPERDAAAAAAPAAAPPAAAPQVDAEALRRTEEALVAEKTRLDIKEADLRAKEADVRDKEKFWRTKDAELATAKKAKPGRLGRAPTSATLGNAIADAQKAYDDAKADVEAAKQAVRTAQMQVTIATSRVVAAQNVVHALTSSTAPKQWVQAATWLQTPLPPRADGPNPVEATKGSRITLERKMIQSVKVWEAFNPADLVAELGDLLVESPGAYAADDDERPDRLDIETQILSQFSPERRVIRRMLQRAFPHYNMKLAVFCGTPTDSGLGGTTDDCMEVHFGGRLHVVYIGEHKRPRIHLEPMREGSGRHAASAQVLASDWVNAFMTNVSAPSGLSTMQENVYTTTSQMVTYMLAKGGLIYSYFCNYDAWCFAKRTHDADGNEVLLLSRYYRVDEPPARLAFAYFLCLAFRTLHETGTLTLAPGTGIVTLKKETKPPSAAASTPTSSRQRKTPQKDAKAGPPMDETEPVDSAEPVEVEEYVPSCLKIPRCDAAPVTSTTQAFGLPLLFHPNSTTLAQSGKSVAFRGIVNGRDLVWRTVDLHGLPKHDKDWPLEEIESCMENEVRVYFFLKADWGTLVPHFVLRGPDFNFLWVTVTSYEGVSLQRLVDDDGGLSGSTWSLPCSSKMWTTLMSDRGMKFWRWTLCSTAWPRWNHVAGQSRQRMRRRRRRSGCVPWCQRAVWEYNLRLFSLE